MFEKRPLQPPEGAPEFRPLPFGLAAAVGAGAGALVVATSFEGPEGVLFVWNAHSAWSLAANLFLFQVWQTLVEEVVFPDPCSDKVLFFGCIGCVKDTDFFYTS